MKTSSKPSLTDIQTQTIAHPTSVIRFAIMTALVGSLAIAACPAVASTSNSGTEKTNIDRSPKAAAERVEERIKTLHSKLGITSGQESAWGDVAQTMRDNESTIAALIEARHKNVLDMTALDDLQSYEDITQAHADGIKKLIIVFKTLYSDMSDEQKKAADKAFGSFEGRHGGKHTKQRM